MTDDAEDQRLDALRRLGILDTPPEDSFDEIVSAAVRAFGVPMAAISLVDRDRQWFKSQTGLNASETPRDVSFCAHAIQNDAVMVVPDATGDPRFADNVLVTDDPALRFYAGAVIRSDDGQPLGALCVIDTVARPDGLSAEQTALLQMLADQVSEQLRLRQLLEHHVAQTARQDDAIVAGRDREDRLLRALGSGAVGWWEWDVRSDLVVGSAALAREFGLDPVLARDGAPIDVFFANIHPLDRPQLVDAVQDAVATGEPFREEYRILHPGGRVVWVSARGRCLRDADGKPDRFPGVVIDISQRVDTERRLREADMGRELAMSAAQLGSWDHDPAHGIRRYDARALAMMGLTEEESSDVANSYAVMHPDDRERVEQSSRAAMNPGRAGPFRETFRIIDRETGDIRWLSAVGRTEFRNGICTRFIGVFDDVTDERVADAHRTMLANEMNHRVKNTLAIVASIVDASIRGADDLASARQEVSQRLASFGRAHDMLTAQSWTSAEVRSIVSTACEALALPAERVEIEGPALLLGPKPALQLALALHELGTNARKYGALLNDTGRVRIEWRLSGGDEPEFQCDWTERGGPSVAPPSRRGFGTRLIEKATAIEFRGRSVLDYRPDGLQWTLAAPYAGLEASGALE